VAFVPQKNEFYCRRSTSIHNHAKILSMKETLVVHWARRDFRLADNPALSHAIAESTQKNCAFLSVFVLEDYMVDAETKFQFGYPSRYFLAKAIPEFGKQIKKFLVVKGKAAQTFITLQKHLENSHEIKIFVNEDVYIDFYKQVETVRKHGISIEVFRDQLTVNTETKSGSGGYYSVFSPFKRAVWREFLNSTVLEKADFSDVRFVDSSLLENITGIDTVVNSFETIWSLFSKNRKFEAGGKAYDIDTLLDYHPDFSTIDNFYYTEAEASSRFQTYLTEHLSDYKDKRDSLSIDGTSKMSLALAWGLTSSRILKSEIQKHCANDFMGFADTKIISEKFVGPTHFISELIWREFYKYLLFHNPNLMSEEFQNKFRGTIQWVEDELAQERFVAWIEGKTGYNVVDAAMMQLAKTGWMHNRARMIVASILTKNLGVDWKWGQEYFRAMLLDLDEASNNGGWQWSASVGADPKPIRIFNPYLQAKNYDGDDVYQKRWLGDENFTSNPVPLVPHEEARKNALKRYGLDSQTNNPVRDY